MISTGSSIRPLHGAQLFPGVRVRQAVIPRWWILLSLCVAVYCAVLMYYSPLLLQDYPNHLARAVVMADLLFDHGSQFGGSFTYHFLFTPYVLADWVLATLVWLVGVDWATRLFAMLVFLSLPASLYAYLRAKGTPAGTTVLLLLLSLYLSTDTFFVLGFLSFRLSVASVLLTLAVAEPLSGRWSSTRYAGLVALVVLGYLTHLAALAFTAVALGTRALLRVVRKVSSLQREALLLLPVGCLIIWNFAVASGYRQVTDQKPEHFFWGTALTKTVGVVWGFLGFHSPWQMLIFAVFVLCLATLAVVPIQALRARSQTRAAVGGTPRFPVSSIGQAAIEGLGVALAFGGVYLAFPSSYSEASFVDVRAMALCWLFLVIGLVRLHDWWAFAAPRSGSVAFGLAILVVALNLGYLGKQFSEDDSWLTEYRSVVAAVPTGSRVLPVYTALKRGGVRPLLHAASYVVTDRAAWTPYLFSGDRGDPMEYFRYASLPYAPDEDWYGSHESVDWNEVVRQYQYLLVMKPFNPARVPITGTVVAENSAAVLLAIQSR